MIYMTLVSQQQSMKDWVFYSGPDEAHHHSVVDKSVCNIDYNTGLTPVCQHCHGINLQDMKSSLGYVHLPTFEALIAFSETCLLCELILNSVRRSVQRQPMRWGSTNVSSLRTYGPVVLSAVSRDVDSQRWKIRKAAPVEGTLVSQNVLVTLGSAPIAERDCNEADALFQMYTVEGSPAEQAGVAVAQRINPDMVSESSIEMIRSWLNQCERSHLPCLQTAAWIHKHSEAPTRLLDVRLVKENWVRLIDTHGQAKEYAALSYCWGKEPPILVTMTETYRRILAGVPCRLLSRSVQDAITVVKKLGIRYLWVDALCIKQNDTEDWNFEAQNMGLIYANAYLTIAATSAKCGSEGFLSARSCNELTTGFRASQQATDQGTVHWRSYPDIVCDYEEYVENSPLLGRGWVKQERLFSRRTVDFCKKRTYLQCRSSACCEGDKIEIERFNGYDFVLSVHLLSLLQEEFGEVRKERWEIFFTTWGTVISDYSKLSLTEPSDRLHAVAGLANIAKISMPGRYLSGIWEFNLGDGLFWRPAKYPMERGEARSAPSWSWASSTREVLLAGYDSTEPLMELAQISQGTNGLERLHVRGRVHRCYVSLKPEPVTVCRSDRKFVDPPVPLIEYTFTAGKNVIYTPGASMPDNICIFDGSRGEEIEFTFLRVSCSYTFKLRHCHGLLLKRVASTDGTFYERVGVGWSSDLTWHNSEASEICLV